MEPVVSYYKMFFGEQANIVFDVGTRDGDDAKYLQDNLNTKTVYAIEAREDAAELTKIKYPDFNIINCAVSDYIGTTEFYVIVSDDKDYQGSSSIYNNKFERPEYPHTIISVPVTTMESILVSTGLKDSTIDIVKVDIEGYTFQFLAGMGDYIKNVKLFHLETETFATHEEHVSNEDIASFMRSNGFKLVAKQYEWGEDIEDQIWINEELWQEF